VTSDRLARALAAIDAANADDPNTLRVRGSIRPKELAHAELATEWIEKLVPEPSDALRLAARAHHVQRWIIPRADYPLGKSNYYRWRKALQAHHAGVVSGILEGCGYDKATTERVQSLVRKQGLGRGDDEMQSLEDALCLVFLETQLLETAAKLDDEIKAIDVLRKTARKMSPPALELAKQLPLSDIERTYLERALADPS
jgi:hypothetical protein